VPLPALLRLLAAAVPTERIQEAAGEVLADPALQRDLPAAAPPPTPPPEWLAALLWALAGAGVLVLVGLAVAWLLGRLRPGPTDDDVIAGAADGAPVAIPIAGARALAAEGRFGEAIHALLLETLEALSRASRLAPSLTSREIVTRVALPARAREALSGLVVAVEVSRFGGAEPGEREFQACLDRFEVFLATYRGAA